VPASVVKKKYLIAVYWNPVCKRKVRARPKDVLSHERFRINLMLLVSFMRVLGITTKRIRMLLRELRPKTLKIHNPAHGGKDGRGVRELLKLKDEIRKSEAVHYDDTGWPREWNEPLALGLRGQGCSVVHVRDTRRGTVVKETLGEGYGGSRSAAEKASR
jgi:hypothetical protein